MNCVQLLHVPERMGIYNFAIWTCVLFYMRCSSANFTSTTPTLTGSLSPESTMIDQTETTYTDPITSGNLSSAGTMLPTQQRTMTTTATEEPATATLPDDETTTASETTEPVTSTFSSDQTTTTTRNADFPWLVLIVAAASASAAVVIIGLVLVIVCCFSKISKQNIFPTYDHADVIRKKASTSNYGDSTNCEESGITCEHCRTDKGNMAHGDTNHATRFPPNFNKLRNRKDSRIYEELDEHLGIEMREVTSRKTSVLNSHSDHQNGTAVSSTIYEPSDVVHGHLEVETSELPPYKPDFTSSSIFYINHLGKRNDIASVIYEAPDSRVSGQAGLGTLKTDAASSSYSALCQLGSKEADYSKLRQYDAVINQERLQESTQIGIYSDPRNFNI